MGSPSIIEEMVVAANSFMWSAVYSNLRRRRAFPGKEGNSCEVTFLYFSYKNYGNSESADWSRYVQSAIIFEEGHIVIQEVLVAICMNQFKQREGSTNASHTTSPAE